jgi:hypothetical protein
LPVTEGVAQRILSLPLFPELKDAQVDFVVEAINEFFKANQSDQKELVTPIKTGSSRD